MAVRHQFSFISMILPSEIYEILAKNKWKKNLFVKTEEITFNSLNQIFSKFASLNLNMLTPTHLEQICCRKAKLEGKSLKSSGRHTVCFIIVAYGFSSVCLFMLETYL